ncbi:MAG: HIT domain-containing protein [Verrucomicrobia bacterium]|nr:HIT domain-containing protein [Verrucomicrobiota bacterium]MBS0646915.1 HIT domain-containing protein [Verrucomicrobiota bacterium]
MRVCNFLWVFWILSSYTFCAAPISCPFCDHQVMTQQLIAEANYTFAIYCLTPMTKGNVLLIPKRHIERFEHLTMEEMLEIQEQINIFSKVFEDVYKTSEFVILQKNGLKAGQSVPHLHFHIIPANNTFDQIIQSAFLSREAVSKEEMEMRVQELTESSIRWHQ